MNGGVVLGQGGAVVGLIVGAVVLIVVADKAPKFVNGLLVIILVGLVLANSGVYTNVLQNITGQKPKK